MLELKIALRYLIALRKASIGQVLSFLSFTGLLLGSMAMLIVLSAFNGFEVLLKELYHFQDPDLQIIAPSKKSFVVDNQLILKIKEVEGVANAFEILKDKAAVRYGEGQMVVEVVGVPSNFIKFSRLETMLDDGALQLHEGTHSTALVSVVVKSALNISLKNSFEYLQLIYPKKKKLLQTGALNIFNKLNIKPIGTLSLDESRIYIPLEDMRVLMDKPVEMNELHVYIKSGYKSAEIKEKLGMILGDDFQILTENEQHADLFKIMKIEKLFVFLALGFVIFISSFNLFVSSSMLVINKKNDIQILAALGMAPSKVSRIIQNSGMLVTVSGLVFGLAFGSLICLLQMRFGFVPLGMTTTYIQAYPIDIQWEDYIIIASWVVFSSAVALWKPARKAAKLSTGFHTH